MLEGMVVLVNIKIDNMRYYGIGKNDQVYNKFQFNIYFGLKGISVVLNSTFLFRVFKQESGEFHYMSIPDKYFIGFMYKMN